MSALFTDEQLAEIDRRATEVALRTLTMQDVDPGLELNVREVARLKNVQPRTVYEWVRTGKIKHHYTPTGRLRFYRRDI